MAKVITGESEPLKSAPNFLIGESDFETYMLSEKVYVDKTKFIKRWWESGDKVTLIVRPRRFLKTSILSMVDKWFNCKNPLFTFANTEILELQTPDIKSSREHLDSIFITLKNIDAKSYSTLIMD